MKNLIPFLLIFTIIFTSCNKEDDNTVEPDPEENSENPDTDITATETCLYSDFDIQENSTISINCLFDLEGQTINIPAGVTFTFDGGDIFNGTLNFSSNGKIDGELLNSTLGTTGEIELIGNEFEFKASRWAIEEGVVTDEVAEDNKNKMNELLVYIQNLVSNGAVDFKIQTLDAYFKVDGYDHNNNASIRLGIKIPSNYNLLLSDNVFFRMQPNDNKTPTLIFIGDGVENVNVNGGNFIGERDEHDYSKGAQEWGHLLRIGGATNVEINGAEFTDAMGDGVDVHAFGHSFDSHHIPSYNIRIINNIFKRNRRNQISVTSGEEVYIENNNFIDCSIHTDYSDGVAPGFAIDVEAFHANGIKYEIAENIYIRNNTETGSRIGAFTIHTGDKVTIENNIVQGFISYSGTTGSKINNNTIKAFSDTQKNGGIAIIGGRFDRYDLNFDNEIKGNIIEDYGTGITVANVDVVVAENQITNCVIGIVLEEIQDAEFYDNKIFSTHASSIGYVSGAAASFINNVTITQTNPNEKLIQVNREPFKFVFMNQNAGYENYRFSITGNNVNSPGTSTLSSNGIIFTNNIISDGGVRLSNAQNTEVSNNTITTSLTYGIRVDSGCSDSIISNNEITATTDNCIFENNTDGTNIEIENNICE